jgi:hypothetical protein
MVLFVMKIVVLTETLRTLCTVHNAIHTIKIKVSKLCLYWELLKNRLSEGICCIYNEINFHLLCGTKISSKSGTNVKFRSLIFIAYEFLYRNNIYM